MLSKYGITNLLLHTENQINIKKCSICFSPLLSYYEAKEKLAHKDIFKEAICEMMLSGSFNEENIVDDICHVLSFGVGCKVNTVYKIDNDQRIEIKNPILKVYSSFNVIPLDIRDDVISFLGDSIEYYQTSKNLYNLRNVINLINDGKQEGDYLESRAIKLCIAFEILKDAYLGSKDSLEIVKNKQFRKIKHIIIEALDKESINLQYENLVMIKENVSSINHFPFKQALILICNENNISIDEIELARITKIRNALVHSGRFVDTHEPFSDYCFLITKISEIILGILKYPNTYLDWTLLDSVNGSDEQDLYTNIRKK